MVHWMNIHQNNNFVNRVPLPLLHEKSGAILLLLVGLMAGRQAGRQATWSLHHGFLRAVVDHMST